MEKMETKDRSEAMKKAWAKRKAKATSKKKVVAKKKVAAKKTVAKKKTPVKKKTAAKKKAPLEREIRAMCNELANFLVKKNTAYGNSVAAPSGIFAKGIDALTQIDVRIDDKLSRLQNGSEYPGDDTEKDLAGYLIIKMIMKKKLGIRK